MKSAFPKIALLAGIVIATNASAFAADTCTCEFSNPKFNESVVLETSYSNPGDAIESAERPFANMRLMEKSQVLVKLVVRKAKNPIQSDKMLVHIAKLDGRYVHRLSAIEVRDDGMTAVQGTGFGAIMIICKWTE